MKMHAVSSSNIKAWGYDEGKKLLHIEFNHGGSYAYHDVPKEVAEGFHGAESAGKHFHSAIRGQYDHSKI